MDLPEHFLLLEFDVATIERVLSNLLENGAQYTPIGSTISIGAAPGDRGHLQIGVEDNGPGIAVGKENDIFKNFERGKKDSAALGVCLGLAICRAIVDAHGGSIRVEGRAGGGARFVFSIPRGLPPVVDLTADDAVEQRITP